MTDFDYAALDRGRAFKYKQKLLENAQENGYTYITEAFHKLYDSIGPKMTAEEMEVTENGLYQILNYIGVKVKRKRQGGIRNTKLTKEKVIMARNLDNGRRDEKYILAMMEVLGLDVSGTCLKAALNHDTWRDD